ncbi:MAG: aminotransferase class V-fold PLP-dependent enzyme [Acidobacteriota bacterium]
MRLPETGWDRDRIFATLEGYRERDLAWRTGRTFGFVYDSGHEAARIGKDAYAMYLAENGLDPTSFPSLMRLENEVVGMALAAAGGAGGACGTFTSGGTESIMLAVKAARDAARAHRPDLGRPEIVLPVTAHAAFHKAAHYLGLEVVVTPIDPATCAADPAAMSAAITERTILLVASAPSYAHGAIDPVADIAAVARDRGICCHVDACVGGWMLPYFRRLGAAIPPYDLCVPGVTSLSLDLHKYAFAPKGASVVLYASPELRRHQLFACASWTGYGVVNTAVQSSKSGGPLAAAWATLHAIGDAGYLELARSMREATLALERGIASIPGLAVLGRPAMSLLAFAWRGGDVFHLADEMKVRGWYLQPQLSRGGLPPSLHITVGPTNAPHAGAFLADIRASVEAARALRQSPIAGQVRDMVAGTATEGVLDALVAELLDTLGAGNGMLPDRMAAVHQILDALPPPLVERALAAFMERAFGATA